MQSYTLLPTWNYYPLDTGKLAHIFDDTTNTYKYWFFLSLLDLIPTNNITPTNSNLDLAQELSIPMPKVLWHMLELAYYPIAEFKIHLPYFDRLPKLISVLEENLFNFNQAITNNYRQNVLEGLGKNICLDLCLPTKCRRTTWPFCANEAQVSMTQASSKANLFCSYGDFLKEFASLEKYVPFRLLSPWIGTKDSNAEWSEDSGFSQDNLPYQIAKLSSKNISSQYLGKALLGENKAHLYKDPLQLLQEDADKTTFLPLLQAQHFAHIKFKAIIINPNWLPYLQQHKQILQAFTYQKLAAKLESINPLMPALLSKLLPQEKRSSLDLQRRYFSDFVKNSSNSLRDIYLESDIDSLDRFALDHFLPWSFVHHDLIWNLTPICPELNSSKSNLLPDASFISKLAEQQLQVLRFHVHNAQSKHTTKSNVDPHNNLGIGFKDLVTDFLELGQGRSILQLSKCQPVEFYKLLAAQIEPALKIAQNQGFANWNFPY